MSDLKSFNEIFTKRIFRVPAYQRGYAWQEKQREDFWEDLISLWGLTARRPERDVCHYTGVLTILENPGGVKPEERWLIDDEEYTVYDVVDGQQRLLTFVLFIQAFIDYVKSLPSYSNEPLDKIYITENLTLQKISDDYLFKTSSSGSRTYKFGYAVDDPSDRYLRHRIFREPGGGHIVETFYTQNIQKTKDYFFDKLGRWYAEQNGTGNGQGVQPLNDIRKKLTGKFKMNEYVRDKIEVDEHVIFETLNYRGKELSCLELLKNRLLYLTTLYGASEFAEEGERNGLQKSINEAWKEVYHQLGRKLGELLDDDEFLINHCRLYFQYDKSKFSDLLLKSHFSKQNIRPDSERKKEPKDIRNYADNLNDSAPCWFTLHYPDDVENITPGEREALARLKRVDWKYFRPLVMAVLKFRVMGEYGPEKTVEILNEIERFIFIKFHLCGARADAREGEFYKLSREFDRTERKDLNTLKQKLERELADWCFDAHGKLVDDFYIDLVKMFNNEDGYYSWSGLKYFLYEYETNLFVENGGTIEQVSWSGEKKDIEHIYPQTPTEDWEEGYEQVIGNDVAHYYTHSIGNLLISLTWKNRSLRNKPWVDKREAFHNGSQSEIKVSEEDQWGPEQIKERGLDLLIFMEKRWRFRFREGEKEKLLFPEMPTTSGPRGDG